MKLSILYRGSLASCNYACPYCPFAKQQENLAQHRQDQAELTRFVGWVMQQAGRHEISILFTPWGEALLQGRYQRAIRLLSHLPHVRKVAIQTNLSGRLDWIGDCQIQKLGLWATYHPGEVSRAAFLAQCARLAAYGVAYSVGVVGLKEHLGEIEALRGCLAPDVYLWVNAYKRLADYYAPSELTTLETIDPFFLLNNQHHPSFGRTCRAGETVFSVDGQGQMRSCHFIKQVIGDLYAQDWETALRPRLCTNATCHCHIGYVHLDYLNLDKVFGEGLLERIPQSYR
jgi:MoaA/NifB/PqqE/SkfB family radical SAM enzyme